MTKDVNVLPHLPEGSWSVLHQSVDSKILLVPFQYLPRAVHPEPISTAPQKFSNNDKTSEFFDEWSP